MSLSIETTGFRAGGNIPVRFTKDGANEAPPLSWRGVPAGTQSFAIIMDDPDAPRGTFTHWMVWDLPATMGEFDGWRRGDAGIVGRNDFGDVDYGGPRPPVGDHPHRYFIRLFALDTPSLGLRDGTSREDVDRAMRGHVLAKAEIMGRFARVRPEARAGHSR